MRRALPLILVLAFACGGTTPQAATTDEPGPIGPPQSTELPSEPPDAPTAPPAAQERVDTIEPAPDFSIETFSGDTFVLSEQTLPVVLNFWAPW